MKMKPVARLYGIVALMLLCTAIWFAGRIYLPSGIASDRPSVQAVVKGPGVFPIADQQVPLEVFMGSSLSREDLENNLFTEYLEEKLGIRFAFTVASASTVDETQSLLFASGDYPPVILNGNLTPDDQVRYGRSGNLIPLNGLIDTYGSRIKEIFRQNPELRKAMTAPDGNIYALPSVNECLHCWYAQKLWINQVWLDKLGLETPRTTDELYRVLQAFKNGDPNGNGIRDEIPLSGAVDSWHTEVTGFLMSAFIYNTDTHYFYMDDGKVRMAAEQPQWRDGLAYIHKLYGEGLIDPGVFTQSLDGLVGKAIQPDNILGSVTSGHVRMVFDSRSANRQSDYVTVPPLVGPEGYRAAGYFSSFDRAAFAITDHATETEAAAAIRLADYLLTEESTLFNEWGPENKWWRKGKEGEIDEHGETAKYWLNPDFARALTQNDHWGQMSILYRDRSLRESWAITDDPYSVAGYEHRLYQETMKNYAGGEPAEVYPDYIYMEYEDAEEAANLRGPIQDYIRTNMVQFIMGVKDTGTDWDDYVDGLRELKLKRYLEIHQEAYDAFRNKR